MPAGGDDADATYGRPGRGSVPSRDHGVTGWNDAGKAELAVEAVLLELSLCLRLQRGAACGAGDVMAWARGAGKGREGAERVDVDYALRRVTDRPINCEGSGVPLLSPQ